MNPNSKVATFIGELVVIDSFFKKIKPCTKLGCITYEITIPKDNDYNPLSLILKRIAVK